MLEEKLSQTSTSPGVYLMKDKDSQVIYVGKALNLRKRLSSYFKSPAPKDPKTSALVKKIFDFNTIITASEKEALVLESNLIKKHRPKYNVILKDDKRYPSLCLRMKTDYPYLYVVRKIKNDGSLYFGPYVSSSAVTQTLKFINKTFKLRKCKTIEVKKRNRPCLNYQLKTCLAPCFHDVDHDSYDEIVREVTMFLKGRTPILVDKLRKDMEKAAKSQDYEKAAKIRDKIFAIEKTLEKQAAVSTDFKDRDVIALSGDHKTMIAMVMFIREGFLLGMRHFIISDTMASDSEIISAFIRQYYEKDRLLPKEILVSHMPEDKDLIQSMLETIKGEKITILAPMRGEKAKLIAMAVKNAEKELKDQIDTQKKQIELLVRLQKKLNMEKIPQQIECFDNSNLSGSHPVSAMVVFKMGMPDKSSYRKYRIRSKTKSYDDYAFMKEVLSRRYGGDKNFPDLVMVDGGKGQLNIAVAVLNELSPGKKIAVIGIAKKKAFKGEVEDKIYLPERSNPLAMKGDGDLLLFLQKIRDEAHRFVISFHRKSRRKGTLHSELDLIPGIGPHRKKSLFKYFGSVKKIQAATIKELQGLPGMNNKSAESVYHHFNNTGVSEENLPGS